MTLRKQIEAALRLEPVERVPFTCYEGLLPADANNIQGLGVVRTGAPYSMEAPSVGFATESFDDGSQLWIVNTPGGTLTQRSRAEPGYGSQWKTEYLIKRPADYEILAWWMEDTHVIPAVEAWIERRDDLGERGIMLASLPRAPFQRLWIEFTGIERLSYDLHDHPERVNRVLEALARLSRDAAQVIAESPAEFVWLPDNITGEITGHTLFRERLAPYYLEIAEILHAAGKRLVCHMDGMMRPLKQAVAETTIDIIEAFTPPPDGNLPLEEARATWQDKALWINFPSSVHLATPERIREVTRELIYQGGTQPGFLIGVTENIPAVVGTQSLEAIAEALSEG
ncbi:MAG: uroporphyrinogen decarboxylase family protein [Candidatus Zipacnadales bacterium]